MTVRNTREKWGDLDTWRMERSTSDGARCVVRVATCKEEGRNAAALRLRAAREALRKFLRAQEQPSDYREGHPQ